jgi:hypothetical protein
MRRVNSADVVHAFSQINKHCCADAASQLSNLEHVARLRIDSGSWAGGPTEQPSNFGVDSPDASLILTSERSAAANLLAAMIRHSWPARVHERRSSGAVFAH